MAFDAHKQMKILGQIGMRCPEGRLGDGPSFFLADGLFN
jgi:hypothetical protein